MTSLPEGWTAHLLRTVCQILDSKRIPINNKERLARNAGRDQSTLYPYFGATGQVGLIDEYIFEGEHVLIGEDGAPFLDPAKATAYIVDGRFWVNNHAHILQAHGSNRYLCYYLNSIQYADHVTGTTRLKLTKAALEAIPVLLPPLPEQHRIVAKIEELFSELDAGTASLTRARAQLKTYRQALLKAAFEGKLTAPWRAANPDKLKSPETLLSRIRTERDTRHAAALDDWQTALSEWRAGGEVGRKPGKPSRPDDIQMVRDTEDLVDLPFGWFYVTTASLGRVETGNTPPTKDRRYFEGEVPFIKPTDLDAGMNVRASRDTLTNVGLEVSRGFPAGTVLVTCIGATIGKTGLSQVAGACNQQINFIVPDYFVESTFMFFQITGPAFQENILGNANSTTLPILNKGKFCELPFAVCVPEEQVQVVAILGEKLSQVDAMETEITTALARIAALRQSILKKAFSGQLVPQDPADEPASALLARLAQAPAPKPRRKTKP